MSETNSMKSKNFSELITQIQITDNEFRKHAVKAIDKLLTVRN